MLNLSIPIKENDKRYFGNLQGGSLAFLISQIAEQSQRFVLAVTVDNLSANHLEEEIKFFSPTLPVFNFPDWETLPYDQLSPHRDLIAQRLVTLSKLPMASQGVLLVPVTTLLQRMAPRSYLEGHHFYFVRGDTMDREAMCGQLTRSGYQRVSQVVQSGEFAVRGSILDLFPTSSERPIRIDWMMDEIDSIRTFDPDTQRSIEVLDKVHLLPAHEFPSNEAAIAQFKQNWQEVFPDHVQSSIYREITQAGFFPGVEYYLPLFFSTTQLLVDYLPATSLIVQVEPIHQQAERFWEEVVHRYEQRRYDRERPVLPPKMLYTPVNELFEKLNHFPQIVFQQTAVAAGAGRSNFSMTPIPDIAMDHTLQPPLLKLKTFLSNETLLKTHRVLFSVESPGRREILLDLLKTIDVFPYVCTDWHHFLSEQQPISMVISPLEHEVAFSELNILVITESKLLGQTVKQGRRRKKKGFDVDTAVRNLAEIRVGMPVVHMDHGVGRYLGLQTLKVGDHDAEFLVLEYAGQDKLYVPVSFLHLISRYSGAELEHAPLHSLGSKQWEKAKRQAQEQVCDVAAELLDIYSKRAAHPGHAFALPDDQYRAFAAAFPFEETEDQEKAIHEVIRDMTATTTMDRLICGDVGFGKTEVAMRAAFIAVQDHRQVAVLVPTTLLAQQHYQNFKDRFADWPVHIEVISRFQSPQQQKVVYERLSQGSVDIIIGTHKLLQKNVHFKNLGLLIVDEEHRFGVKQKEQLKSLRSTIDILMLTATPIPRTLNMAMAGLRELSIIATPPAQRLSIKTFVQQRSHVVIREAILRELLRGGQVYFLHNAVETIEKTADEIRTLVPEARVSTAHGQLRERELENVMADFYHQRFNVLVCTTIIETGIDVPSANTIIIDRADKLGLAQLHQLRGRVGRSHHQAYAYLMTPHPKTLSDDAAKRLDAITSLGDLGVGFTLATQDLEIRGAGELLGENQSGSMQAVGFSLYMELLEHAVQALKSGKTPVFNQASQAATEVDLQIAALIPEVYMADVHTRLMFYRRIANVTQPDRLREIQSEMIDRFGLLPEPVHHLFRVTALKLQAQALGIKKIEGNARGGRIEFTETPSINLANLLDCIQKNPEHYRFEGSTRLRFMLSQESAVSRIAHLEWLLEQLKPL